MRPLEHRDHLSWNIFLAVMGIAVWFALDQGLVGQERVELPNGYWYEAQCQGAFDRRGPVRTIIGNVRDRRQQRQEATAPAVRNPTRPAAPPATIPAVEPQVRPATPAPSSAYTDPAAARVAALQNQVADLTRQLGQAQNAIADCADEKAELRDGNGQLARTVAAEHKLRIDLEATLDEVKARLATAEEDRNSARPWNEQLVETQPDDPWYWQWAPAITGGVLGLLGIAMPWWGPPAWLGYKFVRRRREAREEPGGVGEAPATPPFP